MEKHPINQTCCPGKLEELCQEFIDQTMSNFGHQMTGTQRLWGVFICTSLKQFNKISIHAISTCISMTGSYRESVFIKFPPR